jgi:putative transposase
MNLMKQVIVLKLEATPEQHQALLETVEAFNRGCDYVAEVAFAKRLPNKIALQPLVYGTLRAEFGLSSQMAVRCISKAVEAYKETKKRDRNIQPTFAPHGAMVYDERIMSFQGVSHVSLLTLTGRVLVPLRFGDYQADRLGRRKGQADLILKGSVFYLYVTIDLPSAPPVEPTGVIGVDLGIAEIATDSEGNQYSGSVVKAVRQRVKEHRRHLQKKNSRSAYKRLQKTRRRQSRFVRDTNHKISKELVQCASSLSKALALEDLSGIRERANGLRTSFGRQMRWLLGNWAFDQLRQFVAYKAEAAGIPVIFVDPRNTSRTCHVCGHYAKENRKSQAKFLCLNCGLNMNADLNASRNIKARAEVMPPIVPPVFG